MSNSPFQDTQPYAPAQMNTGFGGDTAPPAKGFPWGCLLGGCLGIMLLGALAVGGVMFGAYRFVSGQVAKYTSDHAVELPSVNITEDEVKAIEAKLENFKTQFESGDEPQELVITIDEINAMIAGNSDLKGHVYVKIVDGNLHADVSVPLDDLPIPGAKGRYFNGSVTLHVEMENGVLIAQVVDAEANGQAVPASVLEGMKDENLAEGMYDDPDTAKALSRCESLEIQADRIVLKVRQKTAEKSDDPATEKGDKPAEPGSTDAGGEPAKDSQSPTEDDKSQADSKQ
jgi:hypothetical protein